MTSFSEASLAHVFALFIQTVLADIPVNLGPQDEESTELVVTDFAFVMDDNRSILVLGASTDNNLVLVDLNDPNFRMAKLALTTAEEANGGNERQIEWAEDTNYVWVNGKDVDEIYVVELPSSNIDDARVAKTITSTGAGDIVFVENYERKAAFQMMQAHTDNTMKDLNALNAAPEEKEDDNVDPVAVAALVVSVLALVVGLFAVFKTQPTNSASSTKTDNKNGDDSVDQAGSAPPSVA